MPALVIHEGVRRDEAMLRLLPAHPTGPTKSARVAGMKSAARCGFIVSTAVY